MARQPPGGAQLVVLVGRDVGRRHVVGDLQVIGRSHDVNVVTEDDGISRRHAQIRRLGPNEYELEDLGSRNGTYLNGTLIKRAALQFGDKIALGEGTVFLFSRQDAFEDRLLQAQRLQALAQLAGGIGHDYNNLLGAALTNVTHIRDVQDLDPKALQNSLAEVEAAVRRAVGLTNQLLAFAEVRRIVLRPVDVSRLVEDGVRLLRRTLDRRVVLRSTIEPALLAEGDASKLLQAMMNLCLNAGDAMPDGGTLTITAERELPESTGSEQVLVVIEDTGVGMDEVTRERIFEPFFTTKPRGKGAGMGLANVYAIVRDHGGSIGVQSEPGKGTRFEIRIPAAEPVVRTRHASGPWPAALPMPQGVVLLVDDEELVRFALSRVLEHAGLEVITANDGAQALTVYEEHRDRIDMVILDLDMPIMDGDEAFVALKRINPDIQVLISSGFTNPDREHALVEGGVAGVLRKPYDSSTLVRAVGTVLREKK